jgi:uncharacterized UPF0160 family protein
MAVAIIRTYLMRNPPIARTSDLSDLGEQDWVVDVGGEYDPKRRRFDHHQDRKRELCRDGDPERPYASAGLVWKELGTSIVKEYVQKQLISDSNLTLDYAEIAKSIDTVLIREIDAWDCGIKVCDAKVNTFSSLVSRMNPMTILGEVIDEDTPVEFDIAFDTAANLAEQTLMDVIRSSTAFALSKEIVDTCMKERTNPAILVLNQFCTWQSHLHRLDDKNEVMYVIYDSPRGWQCWQVPKEMGSFEGRRPLPEKWAGLNKNEFAEASGVPDAEFCHIGRFVCGARSKKGVLALATAALED